MTDSQAVALVKQIVDECADCDGDLVYAERGIEALTRALEAERQKVWNTVTKEFDKKFMASDPRIDRTRDHRVDEFYAWCRRKGGGG